MTTPNMSEKELLTDLLNEEKQLVKGYASDLTETSCTNMRQLLIKNMVECAEDQYNVFDQMKQRNMYQTKDADDWDVQTAKDSMQQLKQDTGM